LYALPKSRFDDLLRLLQADGYEVVGPRLGESAIVYGPVQSSQDLPIGWRDRQSPGNYRLERRSDDAYFGFNAGPHSWKQFLFTPRQKLWTVQRDGPGFCFQEEPAEAPRRAFLGVRACDLHAIGIQDRVFLDRNGRFTDQHYAAARRNLLLIAVECTQAGETCFCTAMGTGPAISTSELPILQGVEDERTPAVVPPDCDMVLTELGDAFVVRAGTTMGERIVDRLALDLAATAQETEARRRVAQTAASMGRAPGMNGVRDLLHRNQEHPRWDDVAQRCLSCTNCTLVCPTCFCSGVQDSSDLSGETAARTRHWDSCFNPDFAAVHGGNYRPSIRGRYRQWLTHKFASWFDQFDVSGCVGCGRCISWCPVGIDVTEEIAAIRQTDGARGNAAP